jgi:hypothetical protein
MAFKPMVKGGHKKGAPIGNHNAQGKGLSVLQKGALGIHITAGAATGALIGGPVGAAVGGIGLGTLGYLSARHANGRHHEEIQKAARALDASHARSKGYHTNGA